MASLSVLLQREAVMSTQGNVHSQPTLDLPVTLCVALLFALWGCVVLFRGAVRNRSTELRQAAVPSLTAQRRVSSRRFQLSSSPLDTHGGIVTAWAAPPTPHAPIARDAAAARTDNSERAVLSSADGWSDALLIAVCANLLSNAIHYGITTPSAFLKSQAGQWVALSLAHAPGFFVAAAVLSCVSCAFVFCLQLLIVRGNCAVRQVAVQLLIQVLVEGTLFFGALAWARSRIEWPVLQRIALAMQIAVLTMKVHSYIVTNRHLAAEVAIGGPGTGNAHGLSRSDEDSGAVLTGGASAAVVLPAHASGYPDDTLSAATTGSPGSDSLSGHPSDSCSAELPIRGRRVAVPPAANRPAASDRSTNASTSVSTPENRGLHPDLLPSGTYKAFSDVATWVSSVARGAAARISRDVRDDAGTAAADAAVALGRCSGTTVDLDGACDASTTPPSREPASIVRRVRPGTSKSRLQAAANSLDVSSSSHEHRSAELKQSRTNGVETTSLSTLEAPLRATLSNVIWGAPRSTATSVAYPDNIYALDVVLFFCSPTLCYDPNFPRSKSIRLSYLCEKACLAAALIASGECTARIFREAASASAFLFIRVSLTTTYSHGSDVYHERARVTGD